MCKIMEDFGNECRLEGEKNLKFNLIPKMFASGDSVEKIAKLLELSLEDVNKYLKNPIKE